MQTTLDAIIGENQSGAIKNSPFKFGNGDKFIHKIEVAYPI